MLVGEIFGASKKGEGSWESAGVSQASGRTACTYGAGGRLDNQ